MVRDSDDKDTIVFGMGVVCSHISSRGGAAHVGNAVPPQLHALDSHWQQSKYKVNSSSSNSKHAVNMLFA